MAAADSSERRAATASTVLVVEDKPAEREALARMLRVQKFRVLQAAGAAEAIGQVDEEPDVVVTDMRLGREDGVDLLEAWKQRRPETPFIVLTAYGKVDAAVRAMKLGAADFLDKPVDPEHLLELVRRCVELRRRAARAGAAAAEPRSSAGFESILGDSAALRDVIDQARRAAAADCTILITGESGVGKELFAEAIHRNSGRAGRPFVPVNMAAVPENLVESELFGHVKGSFTGASESRVGKFESADGGTLFIDEIGDFAQASQAKLLRVLETGVITPVGGNDEQPVDARVLAATSRDLPDLVACGKFRGDLFYRLNVVQIVVPPLRERREDIHMLIGHFLRVKSEEIGREPPTLAEPLADYLAEHDWPGNVRQLANCIESMVVLSPRGTLQLEDVPQSVREDASAGTDDIAIPTGASLSELERAAIEQTLAENDGNRARTAETLGISVRTLQRKLNSR